MNPSPEGAATQHSANRCRVEQLAARLGTLQNRVVFAGECALGFLITNRGIAKLSRPVRSNPVVSVLAYGSPDRLGAELRLLGLRSERSRMPTDFWRTPEGTRLELIAPEGSATIENPWYQFVLECTLQVQPIHGLAFRVAGAPAFLATHLFAIDARSSEGTAPNWSIRLQDIVLLALGRRELEREMLAAPPDVRAHIRNSLERFLRSNDALATIYAVLPRAVRSPMAAQRVLDTLRRIAGLSPSANETAVRSGAYNTALASSSPMK